MDADDFLDIFEDRVLSSKKMFVPSDKDVHLSKNIIRYTKDQNMGSQQLIQATEFFVNDTTSKVITLADFAVAITDIFQQLEDDKVSKEEFKRLLQQTRERMQGDL